MCHVLFDDDFRLGFTILKIKLFLSLVEIENGGRGESEAFVLGTGSVGRGNCLFL